MENVWLTQDFTSLKNENEKQVSGLLPVQFVSPQYVCIVGLQHKGEWMSFSMELSTWLNHNAASKKLQDVAYTLANNLPLCDKNALNVLDWLK